MSRLPTSLRGLTRTASIGGAGVSSVAVLGSGSIGMRHLQALSRIDGVRPVAVPVRAERRSALQEAGYATASDLDEASGSGAVLCIVATDTSRHVEDGLAALERGLDLFVEKPLACDAHDAARLTARAEETGRHLFVGCVLRFSESLRAFRERLCELGPLHTVRIECQSYLPDWRPQRPYRDCYSARAQEGGALRDLIHEVDYAGWIFGWPSMVQARLANLGRLEIEAEEVAELWWRTPEGCDVSIALDYLTRPPRRRMRAAGAHGTLEWDGVEGTVVLTRAGTRPQVVRSAQTRDDLFVTQARAVVAAVAGDTCDPHLATGQEGIRALAVCDAARAASRGRAEAPVVYP